jgi:hypothetical protein
VKEISRNTGQLAFGAILSIIGLAIFVDDLHDFVPVPEWFHWMPEFQPVIIAGFHLEHLYIGALILLIGLIVMARS